MEKMEGNSLAKKFTLPSLIAFAMPNVVMMVFLSLYTIVDGTFIARFAGTVEFSAVNMVYPAMSMELAVGIMIAAGGSAIIARKMGEGKLAEARENFTFLVLVELGIGVVTAALGNLFIRQIILLFGATPLQYEACERYLRILLAFAPAFFLQTAFQTFFVTAGKPGLGLAVTVIGGVMNVVLDYVFMVPCQMGIRGAAVATGIGYLIPALVGILYFFIPRKDMLYFVRPRYDGRVLLYTCTNGSSEMVTNLANAVTTYLFNIIFLKYYGEDGVAAIGIVLYFQFVFTAVYFGYSNGVAPVVSYKYGNGDREQIKKTFQNSVLFMGICSVVMFAAAWMTIDQVLLIFAPRDSNVYQITRYGFPIYAVSFLFSGISIFASALFTAFSNGKVSAIISFSRTFVFLAAAILLLPEVWGEIGIWTAVPAAEVLGVMVTFFYFVRYKKVYSY